MKRFIKPLSLFLLALLIAFSWGDSVSKQDAEIAFQKGMILAIKGYKKWMSPAGAPPCHFHPTCSIYTKECIEQYGAIKGVLLGIDRLTRCHKDIEHYPTVWVDDQVKNLDFP